MLIVTCLNSSSTLQFYQYEWQFEPCLSSKLHLFTLVNLLYFNHSDLSITQSQDDLSYVSNFEFIYHVSSILIFLLAPSILNFNILLSARSHLEAQCNLPYLFCCSPYNQQVGIRLACSKCSVNICSNE